MGRPAPERHHPSLTHAHHVSGVALNEPVEPRGTAMSRPSLALLVPLAAALVASPTPAPAQEAKPPEPLQVGVAAPDFTLPGATRYGGLRAPIHLSDFKGKTVVLAFFYKARTKGRTIQMHAYRDQYAQLVHDGRNVCLMAISLDLADTLAAWARADEFPYLFASDSGGVLGKTYGAHK